MAHSSLHWSSAIALSILTIATTETKAAAGSCVVADDGLTLEPGTIMDRQEASPGWITGETGTWVNVHAGPDEEHAIIAQAWVGSYIDILGQGLSASCETWARVSFPVTGAEGWIHSRFIHATYPSAWW
jgi:hypothetical protein